MNNLIKTLLLAVCSTSAHAAEPTIHTRLQDAVLCRGNPMQVIYDLLESGSNFAEGYAVASVGEEIDTRVVVTLDQPLTIAGATTRGVVGGPGWVDAKFSGDYRRVVKELGLAAPDKEAAPIGKFQKAMPSNIEGKEGTLCPMIIGLTPLPEEGQFLLGCGWCNGG